MDEQLPADRRGDWTWNEQDTLTYRACVSAAYHGRRERAFNVMERVFQAFTAIAATAAFADITGKGDLARWFALAAAIASILPLVFGFASNAQRHGQLKAGFKSLLASIYAAGAELTEEQLGAFKAKVTELESGEPAGLAALVIHCQNEIAARERKTIYPLRFWERCLMHVYSFDGANIVARASRSTAPAV
jgi:hypothetical protein